MGFPTGIPCPKKAERVWPSDYLHAKFHGIVSCESSRRKLNTKDYKRHTTEQKLSKKGLTVHKDYKYITQRITECCSQLVNWIVIIVIIHKNIYNKESVKIKPTTSKYLWMFVKKWMLVSARPTGSMYKQMFSFLTLKLSIIKMQGLFWLKSLWERKKKREMRVFEFTIMNYEHWDYDCIATLIIHNGGCSTSCS